MYARITKNFNVDVNCYVNNEGNQLFYEKCHRKLSIRSIKSIKSTSSSSVKKLIGWNQNQNNNSNSNNDNNMKSIKIIQYSKNSQYFDNTTNKNDKK